MRTRKRTLRPKRSRCCCRGTLRPRRGRRAAAVVQKTIKKLIPRSAGLLLLFLLSVKLEGTWTKNRFVGLRIGSHFATHSSSKRFRSSPPLRPLDRTKEYERTTCRRKICGIYHGHEIRLTPGGRIDPARKRLKLHSEEPDLRRVSSSSSNQVIATVVKGCPKRHKRYVLCIYHVHVCASIAYFNVYSVQSFPTCEFSCLSKNIRHSLINKIILIFNEFDGAHLFNANLLLSLLT